MTNPNSRQISKMIEILKDLEISQQDCELAQSYLSGEVGDEVLDQFERKDLTRLSYQSRQRRVPSQSKSKKRTSGQWACVSSMCSTPSDAVRAMGCSGIILMTK